MEAVKARYFLRGASSLTFGPQIGGMINYELKTANKPIRYSTATFWQLWIINTFHSLAGNIKNSNTTVFNTAD